MLKNYQQDTLDALISFLNKAAKLHNVSNAYEECTLENFERRGTYDDAGFPGIPYVCLRLPTGGGKTILAAYSIKITSSEFLKRDFPLVIWLVPSNAILEQTYNCLQDPQHPYRRVLDDDFDGHVNILTVQDALHISKADLVGSVNVIVSTMAAWRVDSTEGRKVYKENGNLKGHFDQLRNQQLDRLEKFNGSSELIPSLANVINLNNPIVIVDEAHNARTELTFTTLQRLNPSAIIEFTATPKTKGNDRSNVLYSVSAISLKEENMIKMPIELLTIPEWQKTVTDAVTKQNELEKISLKEKELTGEYIRPIVLLQAEHDSQLQSTINIDEIKKLLFEGLKISENQIAIATGKERGIEGLDLLSQSSEIRFVITKQALKEGWDCPFAYIFCSVANVKSSKDVEQLLGRVLRMPKVQQKENKELNKAYAFVCSKDFYATAQNLTDSLIQSGFNGNEAANLLVISQNQLDLGNEFFGVITRTFNELPDAKKLSASIKEKIEINKRDNTIAFNKSISEEESKELSEACTNEEDKEIIKEVYLATNHLSEDYNPPVKRGIKISVPQLLIDFNGETRTFDEEVLLLPGWNLADCGSTLSEQEFPIKVQTGEKGIIDIDSSGRAVFHDHKFIQEELTSLILFSTMDKPALIRWLVKECRNPYITHSQLVVFINKVIDHLIEIRGLEVQHLVFSYFRLRDAIKEKTKHHLILAKKDGYQKLLFPKTDILKEKLSNFSLGNDFVFPSIYPVVNIHQGKYDYKRHYYAQISSMNDEEAECAFHIDTNPNIVTWVRNLERQESYSFWLQTSTDKFYPDFIVKLINGVIIIVEYKSSQRYSDDDSKEKRAIGEFYASLSDGKVRFIMLNGKDWVSLNKVLELEFTMKYLKSK